jgi:hypothetical protein
MSMSQGVAGPINKFSGTYNGLRIQRRKPDARVIDKTELD